MLAGSVDVQLQRFCGRLSDMCATLSNTLHSCHTTGPYCSEGRALHISNVAVPRHFLPLVYLSASRLRAQIAAPEHQPGHA